MYDNFDQNSSSYRCYLDFSKAFDKVPHHILLRKIREFGEGGSLLKFIGSCLSGRHQHVIVDSSESNNIPVTSGVPQGSILGPLFFVCLINDLANVSTFSKLFMYADDSKVKSSSVHDLESDLKHFVTWSSDNGMDFNLQRTQYLVIGSKGSDEEKDLEFSSAVVPASDQLPILV